MAIILDDIAKADKVLAKPIDMEKFNLTELITYQNAMSRIAAAAARNVPTSWLPYAPSAIDFDTEEFIQLRQRHETKEAVRGGRTQLERLPEDTIWQQTKYSETPSSMTHLHEERLALPDGKVYQSRI